MMAVLKKSSETLGMSFLPNPFYRRIMLWFSRLCQGDHRSVGTILLAARQPVWGVTGQPPGLTGLRTG
jgi:hypothetical protein